jgi:hypothetical protein
MLPDHGAGVGGSDSSCIGGHGDCWTPRPDVVEQTARANHYSKEANLNISIATIAQYFRVGLEAECCSDDQVRAWAFLVIAALPDPPAEIFELSWHYPRSRLFDNLNAVRGDADLDSVGNWLLSAIGASMRPDSGLRQYLRRAMYVVRATHLSQDIEYELDSIDDCLQLSESGDYGNEAECRQDLIALLGKREAAPFANGWSDITFDAGSEH